MPLGPVFLQASVSSRIRFPAPLGSTGISRFIATTGALTPHGVRSSLDARSDRSVHGVSLILSHRLPAILSSTISVRSGDRPDASRSFLPRQTSPHLPRARPRLCRPNQVHVGDLSRSLLLRTGGSRSIALHLVLPQRSYGSIPHGYSPQGRGLSPLCLCAFSGARVATSSSPFHSLSQGDEDIAAPKICFARRGRRFTTAGRCRFRS